MACFNVLVGHFNYTIEYDNLEEHISIIANNADNKWGKIFKCINVVTHCSFSNNLTVRHIYDILYKNCRREENSLIKVKYQSKFKDYDVSLSIMFDQRKYI